MAFKPITLSLASFFFGVLAFILGVIAENKKPAKGIALPGKDGITCKFPSDPTIALGIVSLVSFTFSIILGIMSVFYPYKGISVPKQALFKNTTLLVFYVVAVLCSILGVALTLWAVVVEILHHVNNTHNDLNYECPTAKTGLFGGAAFVMLDASLFWLICQMLGLNARADYLDEDTKGDYGQVVAIEHEGTKA